ncbi:site-specific integrase [bacterium]|nr:site-specific integrase [bacterium]
MTYNASSLLVAQRPGEVSVSGIPAIVTECGAGAKFAWEEFFLGTVRNAHTRKAYLQAVRRFLAWCESVNVELPRITPGMVGQYLDELPLSTPSKKLHLAAIRSFLDVLVQRHVIILNPALSVRAPRYSALEGKTPEITVPQCRALLASIRLNTAIDYRDRAIIAMLIYTAARVGAVSRLRLKDYCFDGTQHSLRFSEKGGKSRLIPVRADLERIVTEYSAVSTNGEASREEPIFRTASGRSGRLTEEAMSAIDMCRMVKRRLKAAGIMTGASPHSFRACTATDLLLHGTELEAVQHLLGHSDSRVTKLYDRRQRQVTRNIVERISV